MTLLIECFHLQNETLVNGVQDMSKKRLTGRLIRFVGSIHLYQAPESYFIAAHGIGAHEVLFNL